MRKVKQVIDGLVTPGFMDHVSSCIFLIEILQSVKNFSDQKLTF
jgi:hypothetical protein